MKEYIFEYRDENYKPQWISVEAESKKGAIAAAQAKMQKGWYLVASPKRMFVGPQGILKGKPKGSM